MLDYNNLAGGYGSVLGKRPRVDAPQRAPRIVRPRLAPRVAGGQRRRSQRRRPRRTMESFGQGSLTRSKRSYGRSLRRASNKYARLMLNATANRLVYGLSDYTTFGGPNGARYLENWFPGAPGPYYTPCHLWDVTCAPNNVSGFINTAQSGYKLCFTDPTSGCNLVWLALSNAVEVLNSGHGIASTQSLPNTGSLLRGVSAKFMFYSSATIPSRIRISLIQIRDDRMHPPKIVSGVQDNVGQHSPDGTAFATITDRSVVSLWQNVVHSYAKNPVCTANNNNVKRQIKVIKSHSFILNPKETSDTSAATYHQFNFYHKFARRMKYNWADDDKVDMRNNDEQFIDAQENKCCVEPKARMYLMVTADSVYNNGAEQVTSGAPSYDIALRFYHDDLGA